MIPRTRHTVMISLVSSRTGNPYVVDFDCWVGRVLRRTRHVWVENPWTLLSFAWRLAAAVPYGLAQLGSRNVGRAFGLLLRQFFKTFFRSVVPVAALGVAGALGIGAVLRLGGSLVQPLFEGNVLPILVRDVGPLALAVGLAARMGVSMTVKLAVLPEERGAGILTFGHRELNEAVFPRILAGIVTAPFLFALLAWLFLAGYESAGNLAEMLVAGAPRFFRLPPETWPPLVDGAQRSMVFGGIVGYVAAALGVRAAEHFAPSAEEGFGLNNAVWEASAISILACAGWTILSLGQAGNP